MTKIDGVRYLNSQFKKALILENPDPSLDEYLRAQGIEPQRVETQDEDEVVALLKEGQHDLIYKRSRFVINERVLKASEKLAAVMLCCIGDDSVDKRACAQEGVLVMNDPISNGWSVVELVFGEMITMARRIYDSVSMSNKHQWGKDNIHRYELRGKTLGIIGLGNIGKQVAQLAEAFHMDVIFYDSNEIAREVGNALGWRPMGSIAETFQNADILTMHVSAEDVRGQSNKLLLNYAEHFSQMGKNRQENSPRIFVNASRGFVHDPEELIRAVDEGTIRYAMADVFPEEPGNKQDPWVNPYAGHERIYSTPHIGAATQEAQPRIAKHIATTTRLLNCYGTVRDTVYSPGVAIGVEAENPSAILTVVHSDKRGTKKAIDDCIYEAGLSNLQSRHRDFPRYGLAYDVAALDKPLSPAQLEALVAQARQITQDPTAIRALRVIMLADSPCAE